MLYEVITDLLDVVFQLVLECEGAEAAYGLVRDELRRNPTVITSYSIHYTKLYEADRRFVCARAEGCRTGWRGGRLRSERRDADAGARSGHLV